MTFSPFFTSVLEQHLVELSSLHLPGRGTFSRVMFLEEKRLRFLAGAGYELHARFPYKWTLLHFFEDAQPLKTPVGFRHQ